MEYNFSEVEAKWREFWKNNQTYHTVVDVNRPKYYGLTMFPYPSGAGLHVGHPLGYIASDVYARYKKLKGFNVLHPMGYDSFGLPAEQYAIQTGQHPETTTEENLKRYRQQLDLLGFSFDWEREVRTSDPQYYKWTQWIFKQIFNSYYDNRMQKAQPIQNLITYFESKGNHDIDTENDCKIIFNATEWNNFNEQEKAAILMDYRLAYLADSWVNWCPELGTVLANDEVINGVSERGGFPVEQKLMRQWSMRITAYAERLLEGLDQLDWTDAIKDIQRNWIGKSEGASVFFEVEGKGKKIEVFTTRPDTIFGVSFMVLAPEHELVDVITSPDYKEKVAFYKKASGLKTERDRMANTKVISGEFTGAYAIHPFDGTKIPIWIGDYVLASYGTGAVMAVPCGDQRDWNFAQHFDIPIRNIFANINILEAPYTEKNGKVRLANSDFLNGLDVKNGIKTAIERLEDKRIGYRKINYRLRDAVFSRQRYWGEPFPIYYKNEVACAIEDEDLPITLPEVDNYKPTKDGRPPLGNAKKWYWDENKHQLTEGHIQEEGIYPMELNTMPGWAGSSWYFLRYMDPKNATEFVAKEKVEYWNNVDLYIGGAEHATGHLLYARFWSLFLYDLGYIPFKEPFQKMINQGMILGRSSFVYRDNATRKFVSFGKIKEFKVTEIHVDINLVDNDKLDIEGFRNWRPEFKDAEFILEDDGTYRCGSEIEKMSKSKFNIQNPDNLVKKYGADTLRIYEMFLGPIEQAKPWDIKGINGVSNFLRKLWRLFHNNEGDVVISNGTPTPENLKTLHKTIKRMQDDMDRYVFNTSISAMMICVNELTEQKCNNTQILEGLILLLAPYAPHISEELWCILGHKAGTIGKGSFPIYNPEYLKQDIVEYPISFNGKMRFKAAFSTDLSKKEIEKSVLEMEKSQKYLEGKIPKKVIVVLGKIVNVVM